MGPPVLSRMSDRYIEKLLDKFSNQILDIVKTLQWKGKSRMFILGIHFIWYKIHLVSKCLLPISFGTKFFWYQSYLVPDKIDTKLIWHQIN